MTDARAGKQLGDLVTAGVLLTLLLAVIRSALRVIFRHKEPPTDGEYNFGADPQLVLELAKSRLQNQLAFADALDSKLGSLFAAASALVGLLAAVLAIQAERLVIGPEGFGNREMVIFSVAVLLYIIAALCSLTAWPRTWKIGPKVEDAFEEIQSLSRDQFIARQISGYVNDWNKNESRNNLKVWGLRVLFPTVAGEVGCLVAAIWTLIY